MAQFLVSPGPPGRPVPPGTPGPGELRACVSRFATGVTVVTYAGDAGPHGITVNSFTSVSADPPLVLVSIARTARSHDPLLGRPFCVNVLGAEQQQVARHFAGSTEAADPYWAPGTRVPRLVNPLAWLECEPWRTHEGGDHTLVLGHVVGLGHRDGDALVYAWSRFGSLTEAIEGHEHLI